jgi:hypothetical protein
LSKTLSAFAMQFYYENSANATNQNKYLGGFKYEVQRSSVGWAKS